jgi:hypothetical protein
MGGGHQPAAVIPRTIPAGRGRQEASAFTWAHVAQGEPKFAPRPIEAGQPESVRREWADRRSSTCYKLAFSDRVHYVELRKLLIDHGDRLARDIDGRSG